MRPSGEMFLTVVAVELVVAEDDSQSNTPPIDMPEGMTAIGILLAGVRLTQETHEDLHC